MKVSKEILDIVQYKSGRPISEVQRLYGIKTVYKLASNENPLGSSPRVIKAIETAITTLHRYPDSAAYKLLEIIEEEWKIPAQQIAIGNGSNELIDLMIRIFCEPGEAILTSEAAFLAYQICAQAARAKCIQVPLRSNYSIDVAAFVNVLKSHPERHKIRLVFLPNPNNPTGSYVPAKEIEVLLQEIGNKEDVLVVFDEAYNEYVRAKDYKSGQDYMLQYNNVVVIRTLSKAYGLAGLRVGILLASPEVVDLINRVRNPFNVNELAQIAASVALKDHDFVKKSCELTWEGLDYFYKELKKMGLPHVESQGNFVMFDTLRDANQVNEALLRRGVILRPISNYGFKTHLRMSVGTPHENQTAIQTLNEVFKEIKPL